MRITVHGSVKFAPQMVSICNKLKELGHEPIMHEAMYKIADGSDPGLIAEIREDHGVAKRKHNFIKIWHGLVKDADAILVCNFDKNGVENYIGGNTLLEMGFAHIHDKKVYLLNPMPKGMMYDDEIKALTDEVINGDLSRIN